MGESVRVVLLVVGGVRQRGVIVDGKSSAGPAVSYSKRLCGLAIFFILSRSPLRGFFILLLLSVCVPISSPLSFLFHDVPFFPCMPRFLQALWFFFIVPSLLSQSPVFASPFLAVCISFLYFYFSFITPQSPPVSASSISTDSFSPLAQFHPSFLPIVFSTASFLPAFQSLWSEASVQLHFPYYTPPFYCVLCAFCHLLSPSLLKSVHTWSLSSFWFPEWMVIFCSFPCGYQMGMCVSIVLHT